MHSTLPLLNNRGSSSDQAAIIMNKVDPNVKSPSRSRKQRLDSPTKARLLDSPKKSSSSSPSSSSHKKSSDKKSLSSDKKLRSRSKSRSRDKSRGRSKSRSRKQNSDGDDDHELSIEEYAERLPTEYYGSWDFGKPKTFKRPKQSTKTNRAATTINKIMRGWWARLLFKLKMLQFKFENKDLLTQRALAKVKDKHTSKKEKVRQKLHDKHEKSLNKVTKDQRAAQEAQKLIQQLRDENKKLRNKNQKVFEASKNLKQQNDRLKGTTSVAEGNIDVLNKHAKQIKDTHDRLQIVEPRYKASVAQLAEGVEVRRQFCTTERQMKLMYVKCVGAIVDLAEDKLKDKDLLDEIVGFVLDTENVDHEEPLPEKVKVEDPDDDSDYEDDDSIDAYSVHSYDS